MLILGLLAILQVVFLPGYLLLRFLKLGGGLLRTIIFSFALSLISNYILALVLTSLHLYTAGVVYLVFLVELILLARVCGPFWQQSLETIASRWSGRLKEAGRFFEWQNDPTQSGFARLAHWAFFALAGILALSAVIWLGRVFLANLGTVFNSWDAILSWNDWAVQWSHNHFPTQTQHYPQLLPANLSMIYVFIGSDQVQLFGKAIMPLFTLYMLLLMLDLGLEYRSAGFFVAAVIIRYMLKKMMGEYIPEGYADLPSAFFALAAVVCLILVRRGAGDRDSAKKYAHLGMLLAAGSAVTKQAGLYVFLLYPLLLWFADLEGRTTSRRDLLRRIGTAFAIGLLVVAPWYLYKQAQITLGLAGSEVAYVTGEVHRIPDVPGRVAAAFQLFGKYAALLVLLIPFGLMLDGSLRAVAFLVILPFWLAWAAYFSYEVRNAAVIMPLLGLISGLGIERAVHWTIDLLDRIRLGRVKAAYGLVLLPVLALAGYFLAPDQHLIDQSIQQQKQIFASGINARLYELFPEPGPGLKILTNYPIAHLPGFEQNQVSCFFRSLDEFEKLRGDPAVRYILLPDTAQDEIVQDVLGRVESGEYKLIFEDSGFGHVYFVKIR